MGLGSFPARGNARCGATTGIVPQTSRGGRRAFRPTRRAVVPANAVLGGRAPNSSRPLRPRQKRKRSRRAKGQKAIARGRRCRYPLRPRACVRQGSVASGASARRMKDDRPGKRRRGPVRGPTTEPPTQNRQARKYHPPDNLPEFSTAQRARRGNTPTISDGGDGRHRNSSHDPTR